MYRRVVNWLEERTGVETALRHFLNEDIPESSGWHQVFGSVALFAFLIQVLSGVLLALNYAPTPGEAYDSLRYIMTQVTAGPLIRGMHHWGASLMIVVVVLHMVQAFLWGAYKRPREATWMSGVILLLLTLAYGLSGYLLPWDNRAYWGTVVTTQIAGLAPGVGLWLLRLVGSDGTSIGVITFTRFYVAHVLLLPPLTMLLVGLHVYLVRRHGVAPVPADEGRPKKKFFPRQVAIDTVAIFIWFAVLTGLTILARVPLGHIADPTNLSYVPRPEWYFLFLFQFLKWFQGPLEVVGAVLIPTLAVAGLLLIPFIDRSKMASVRQRTGAMSAVVLAAIFWSGLTAQAVMGTPASREMDMSLVQSWQEIPAANLAAIGYFRKAQCGSCHAFGTPGPGPDLSAAPSRRPADWIREHIASSLKEPDTLKDSQIAMLAAFTAQREERTAERVLEAWQNAPQSAVDGALVYQTHACGGCHKLNGLGGALGPPMNGLGERRERSWVDQHFTDPAKLVPGTMMPPSKLTPEERRLVMDYILAIP